MKLPPRPIDLGLFRGHKVLLVPVADLPTETLEPTWGPGGSSKSASYEALAECVWRFQREVLPEILTGIPLDDLARKYPTTRADGLPDWTSISTVVTELLNYNHGVVVSWSGDKWVMEGGRHRLDLARKLGISHMPVVVRYKNLPQGLMPWVVEGCAERHSGLGAHFDGGGHMSGQTRVTPGELEDFARKFQARAREIDDRLQSIRDGLRALGRTFDDPDFARFQENFERSSRSIWEFTEFSGTEANRMLLMAEDARRKEEVAKGGA